MLPGIETRFVDGEIQLRMPGAVGWQATGDLGREENGRLVVTGRASEIIIRGGENMGSSPTSRGS
ncbi:MULTISPECIES: hypothetical protein [Kitasatospora]|uniref:Uncharacterized protein n=1 Tax=Kitasatospora cathayae TaxID=3004092 RepID=A0ABY7QEJ5_9ACTN|nr:hypothetical protein [Kitasatospora sp. HUAS 3-15]WBP91156.1 hypothetical protein O1G21_38285 [Kitasatospora sp. HUAS 3-15]